MAYLGHSKGPKMSEILKRNRIKLVAFLALDNKGKLSSNIADLLIAEEERKERKGEVTPARIEDFCKKGEFVYTFDPGDEREARFHYTLDEEEIALLGESYSQKRLPNLHAIQDSLERAIWDEQTGYGEFSGPGVS
jgi:hypothetical protein